VAEGVVDGLRFPLDAEVFRELVTDLAGGGDNVVFLLRGEAFDGGDV